LLRRSNHNFKKILCWAQDVFNSSDMHKNGYILMHCSAWWWVNVSDVLVDVCVKLTVGRHTLRREKSSAVLLYFYFMLTW